MRVERKLGVEKRGESWEQEKIIGNALEARKPGKGELSMSVLISSILF